MKFFTIAFMLLFNCAVLAELPPATDAQDQTTKNIQYLQNAKKVAFALMVERGIKEKIKLGNFEVTIGVNDLSEKDLEPTIKYLEELGYKLTRIPPKGNDNYSFLKISWKLD